MLVSPTSDSDVDVCTSPGCSFPNGEAEDVIVLLFWHDNGFGGQFGYYVSGVFTPTTNANLVTHYKSPKTRSGTVEISLFVDDQATYADDPVVSTNPPQKFTCWEFIITRCPSGWIPAPTVIPHATVPNELAPDSVSFTATITPDTAYDGASMANYITFTVRASTHPGYCCNSPSPWWVGLFGDGINPEPYDSILRPQAGFGYSPGYLSGTSSTALLTATHAVWNYDFGTDSNIEASIGLGRARVEGFLDIFLSQFPIDMDHNAIADAASQNGGGALPVQDDDGGQGSAGDGLTRYEEYRGFLVQNAHRRTNATAKDVFIHDQHTIYSQGNFTAAVAPLPMTVHLIWAAEFNGTGSRVVNFRNTSHHKIDQHGLWLADGDLPLGYHDWGAAEPTGVPIGPPRTTTRVVVDLAQITADMQADRPTGATSDRAADAIRMVMTHELGHAIAMPHHGTSTGLGLESGDTSCAMRYNWSEINAARLSGGNNAAAWANIQFGTLFCTAGDDCQSRVRVDDWD